MSEGIGAEHQRHLWGGEPDEDLIEALEPDQLVHAMDRPLPRRRLGAWAEVGLWALLLFVLTMSALVVYTFVASISHPG